MTTVQREWIRGDHRAAGLRPGAVRRAALGRPGPDVAGLDPGSLPPDRRPFVIAAVIGLVLAVVVAGVLSWRAAIDADDNLAARGFRGAIDAELAFRAIAVAPDGTRVFAATGAVVEVWHVATRRRVGPTFTGHSGTVTAMALSPNGRQLATTGDDATTRIWDVTTGRQLGDPIETEPVVRPTTLVFSPDGGLLAASGEAGTALWDVAGRQRLGVLDSGTGAHSAVAFSPDGTRVATGEVSGGTVTIWDAQTRQPVGQPLTGHAENGPVSALAYDSSGTLLADGSADKASFLYDTRSGQYTEFRENKEPIHSVVLTRDGSRLITASSQDVLIWDVASVTQVGRPITEDGSADVHDIALGPDGDLLVVIRDHRIQFWSLAAATRP